jgi:hypothetical protein
LIIIIFRKIILTLKLIVMEKRVKNPAGRLAGKGIERTVSNIKLESELPPRMLIRLTESVRKEEKRNKNRRIKL